MSKHVAADDIGQFMIDCGCDPRLLNVGFVGHVHEVNREMVTMRMPCGEFRDIQFDFSHAPNPIGIRLRTQWLRKLRRAYATCSLVRWIGSTLISGKEWRADHQCLLLPQGRLIEAGNIRFYELFCGGIGGWSRAIDYLRMKEIPVETIGSVEISGDLENDIVPTRCIVDDINKMSVWEQIAEGNPDAITISSSCRSFSAGDFSRGGTAMMGTHLRKHC